MMFHHSTRIKRFGTIGLLLALGVTAGFAFWPETVKPTPKVETLLPANAVAYFTWSGEDAYKKSFEKTAAYDALYKSGLLAALQKMSNPMTNQMVKNDSFEGDIANFLFKVMHKMGHKGVSGTMAIASDAGQKGPATPYATLVLHEGGQELYARLEQLMRKIEADRQKGDVKKLPFQKLKIGKRTITQLKIPARQAQLPFDLEFGWWTEGKHLLFVVGHNAVSRTMATITGKQPNITTNPLWKKYRTGKKGFEISTVAWCDFGKLAKEYGDMPVDRRTPATAADFLKAFGLGNVGALVVQNGYRGVALWSEVTLEAPGKRTGLLALGSQRTIGISQLPPLPKDLVAFHARSLDLSKVPPVLIKIFEEVTKLAPPNDAKQMKRELARLIADPHYQLGIDIINSLNNVFCAYVDKAQGPFGIGAAVAIGLKDPLKLRTIINQLLAIVTKEARPDECKVVRTKKHGREIITLEIARGIFNPSFVIDDDWLVIGLLPQTVEAFLLRLDHKLPKWSVGPEHRAALADLPKRFTSITVTDPREVYRWVMGVAPIAISMAKVAMYEAGIKTSFKFNLADFPPTELVTRKLFPNVTVVTVDDAGFRMISRTSLPMNPLVAAPALCSTLVTWLVPAGYEARQAARRSSSKNNLKQLGLAIHNYHEVRNRFPNAPAPNAKLKPEKQLGWLTDHVLLHMIEAEHLARGLKTGEAWDSKHNITMARRTIPTLQNPGITNPRSGDTHYVGMAGVGVGKNHRPGIFSPYRKKRIRFRDITDGTSSTIMITEASKNYGSWAAGGSATIRGLTKKPYVNGPDGIGGPFKGGFHAAMADGSVRFVSNKVKPDVFEASVTIDGGEEITISNLP